MCHSTIIGFNHQGIGRGVMGIFDCLGGGGILRFNIWSFSTMTHRRLAGLALLDDVFAYIHEKSRSHSNGKR